MDHTSSGQSATLRIWLLEICLWSRDVDILRVEKHFIAEEKNKIFVDLCRSHCRGDPFSEDLNRNLKELVNL